MAILAIKGHKSRGNEVIEILEMLGGENRYNYCADCDSLCFYMQRDKIIYRDDVNNCEDLLIFTLEDFLEKFPYKIGDKVNSKYLKNYAVSKMEWESVNNRVIYKLQGMGWYSAKELNLFNEPLNKEETIENKLDLLQQLKDYFDNTPREVVEKEWHEYDKYNEIGPTVDEYLEYVNKIRQPKYPKTYEECCDVLKIPNDERYIYIDVPLSYNKTLKVFTQLLICRDAYWEIVGWRPTKDDDGETFSLFYNRNSDKIDKCDGLYESNAILDFPTKELREAFYENFKELINQCKELL